MRVKAVIAYDGSSYFGFQKQKSTQQTVTTAIETALKELQIVSSITGSGRTDAGVHATGQIIHFDLPSFWQDLQKLKTILNRKLSTIQFKHISPVSDDFHARFSAKKRIYRYVFKTQNPSVFEKKYISYYPFFEASILQKALSLFQGKHDFSSFQKTGSEVHSTVREIYHAHYMQRENYHFIYFCANGFLRSQVRMMVEASIRTAQKRLDLETLHAQIECRGESVTKLAPPQGLYLAKIIY